MAGRLMRVQLIVAAAALVLSAGSTAQALTDPTRPPLELMRAETSGAAPRTPLQSILLSRARQGAIINGQYVPLGGSYGKAKLVKLTATEVTLKGDKGLEVLQLYPPLDRPSAALGAEGKSEKTAKRP